RTITRVSRADVERAPVQSLADLLKLTPGVDVRQRGPCGAQADVSLRGSTFDQTMVLLNGINISDPQTGHLSLSLPVDLESIEKIEILEGPAARIFGSNALGGAVNLITGTGEDSYLKAGVAGGQYGLYRASAAGSLHTRRTAHHLAASRTASDGYMHNTGFDNLNVFSQNKWKNAVLPLDMQLGYLQKETGANGFYGAKYPDQYEAIRNFFGALKAETTGRTSISASLSWRRNYDHYLLNRNRPEDYENFHLTDVYGGNFTASLAGSAGRTNIGAFVRGEHIFSNNMGVATAVPRKVPRQAGKHYDKADRRTSVTVFAEHNLHRKKWSASAGLSLNRNSYTGNKINLYPGVDLACYPGRLWKLFASVNRAMRLPTFTDLYYQSPMITGNRHLKPERCTEAETGAKISLQGMEARLGYFYRHTADAIDWIRFVPEEPWHTQNLTELRTHGLSLDASWNVQTMYGGCWIRSASASFRWMTCDKSSGEYMSYYVLDYLKRRFSFSFDHRIFRKINAAWYINRQVRNGSYSQYHPQDGTESEVPYEAFWQIDLRIYYRTPRWNIFAEATNLTNRRHQDIGNITLPGIWARAGVEVTVFQQ
ncbi:MAG: TonB-dependent receptor, partial [Bacteroidales bacterium]|nr:TonB-dependent receptor [Bacteroidales bacterium]